MVTNRWFFHIFLTPWSFASQRLVRRHVVSSLWELWRGICWALSVTPARWDWADLDGGCFLWGDFGGFFGWALDFWIWQ
jgi:hypothetical protein